MSRSIELSDEDYTRLEQAALQERTTPAEWVARRIPICGEAEAQPSPNGKPEGQAGAEITYATMAARLAGRIGRLSGSGGLPSSDDVAKSFAEYLEAKQREGRL